MKKTLGIVNFSVEKRVTIVMLCLIIMVFGFISLRKLGLDMLPDITFPMVSVVAQYPGVAPEEIEQLITIPLEGVIAGVTGVKKMSSVSSEGMSAINVEFEWGTNLDYAAQDIKDYIDFIRDFLPKEMKEPVVYKFNLSQIPIMFLGVSGIDDTYKLRKLLEDNVVERLQRLDGVAQAMVYGGERREVRVALDLAKITYRGLAVDQITSALSAQNLNMPAGYHVDKKTDFLLRSIGEFKTLDDIRNAIVGHADDGTPIRLRDIADVKDTYKEKRSSWRLDGDECVFLVLNKRSGANTLQVSNRVNSELEKIKREHPELVFATVLDQGQPVKQVVTSTSFNALVGGFLAILFMLFFLRNIRPTIAIGIAIPLSIVATFIAIHLAGHTLNLMTLGGLALGVGMLVDNAIVVIENIYRHLEHGKERSQAAKLGASEVAMAITASTFTTVVVFLPLLFSEGLAAQLTKGLCITIIFALLSSLMVALTIVPMLASVLFKEHRTEETSLWFNPVREFYGRCLNWSLSNPWKTFGIVTLFVAASITIGVKFVGAEFMPAEDSKIIILEIEMPVGTPLEDTKILCDQVRELIREYPEVETIGESVGREEDDRGGGDEGSLSGPHSARMFIRLIDAEKRKLTSQELQDIIRKRLPNLNNQAKFDFLAMNMMGSDKPVNVKVYGKNLSTLEEITDKIMSVMQSIPSLKDIETSFSKGRPEYHFIMDRQKALMLGLSPYQIQSALKTANLGTVNTRFRTGEDEIDIRVILDKKYRGNIEWIKNVPLKTPTGAVIPLSQVVTTKRKSGLTVINRDSKFRVGTVEANLTAGVSLRNAVEELENRLKGLEESLPDGYSIELRGQIEDMRETYLQLAMGLALAILLVYMVMASQFESLVHPFIIMFTFPLAVMGVALILLITGKTFSVVTFVGIIILAGIAVNNGIVLVDYVNQLRRNAGMDVRTALLEGGKTRIRPVLITAGTTIVGMLPMAFSTSEGAEMRSPMALTVIGGLVSATFLTLFIIPVVYLGIDKIGTLVKNRVKRILH